MSKVPGVGWFDWPVACPQPSGNAQPTRQYVENWLSQNGNKVSFLGRASYGTCAGATTCGLGILCSILGFVKEKKVAQWIGNCLALVGAVAALIGQFCGIEFNLISKIHNKVIFKSNSEINEEEIKKAGIKDKEILIDVPGTKNEKLHGYYLPSPIQTDKAVIYLHGRAHNNGTSAKSCLKLQEHIPVNVLMVDYRGSGKSPGIATPESVVKDAEVMYDYLIQKGFKPENITVYGHSLGGAVAIELASKMKDKIHNLIIQSSFSSLKEVAREYRKKYLWFVPSIVASIVNKISPNTFNSKETIKEIDPKTRLLILHGADDEYISLQQSNELFNNASAKDKKLTIVKGIKHSDFCDHLDTNKDCIAELREFIGVDDLPVEQSKAA